MDTAMCSYSLEGTVQAEIPIAKDQPDENWATAQERLLLYLTCMHVPPGKDQLLLALEALRQVKGQGNEITPAALQAVQDLLRTSNRVVESSMYTKIFTMGRFDKEVASIESVPPLNRGHMAPLQFEQLSEWFSPPSFLAAVIVQLRPFLLPIFILLNLLLLLCLYFWL
jgi:hypothetical protein